MALQGDRQVPDHEVADFNCGDFKVADLNVADFKIADLHLTPHDTICSLIAPCCITIDARASAMSDATPKSCFGPRKRVAVAFARGLIAAYRLTLSPVVGFNCRHLPTCSQYADEAIERYGLWAGGWMALARLSRCHPFGTSGLDFVARALPENARWYLPWRYGRWRGVNDCPQ